MKRLTLLHPTRPSVALLACAAFGMALAPQTARAQQVPDDDVPARTAPAAAPGTPAPAPAPGTVTVGPPTSAEGGKLSIPDDAPPLPRGTVVSPMYYDAPRYTLRYEERRMTSLMAAGLGVFGGAYLLSVGFGAYAHEQGWFLVPVIGPVIYTSRDRIIQGGLVFDTIVQASGVIMFITGALVKTKVAVRAPVAVLPIVVPGGGAGLAAVGTW